MFKQLCLIWTRHRAAPRGICFYLPSFISSPLARFSFQLICPAHLRDVRDSGGMEREREGGGEGGAGCSAAHILNPCLNFPVES